MTYSNTVESAQGSTSSGGAAVLRDGSTYYDTASSRVQQAQRADVTEQIRQYHELYGGSDNTQSSGLASSKSLNYAPAPTLQQAQRVSTSAYPFTFKLVGSVGLMGAENYYIRVDVDLVTPLDPEYEEFGWFPADLQTGGATTINTYESAVVNYRDNTSLPEPPEGECTGYIDSNNPGVFSFNCYQSAVFTNPVPLFWDPLVSVDLTKIGVNNIYIDNWVDTMIYTRTKRMWGYDKMYIRPRDHFYIGIHARNTRQLPYNVEVTVGDEFLESAKFIKDKELVAYSNI